MSRVLCFYHSSDLDGHCSGAIVKYKFPNAVMYPIDYGDEFPWSDLKEDDTVFMVDFSLQPAVQMYDLLQYGVKVIWIDHHDRVIKNVSDLLREKNYLEPGGIRSTSCAACELTWTYLFPDKPVPTIVKLLSLYDSWTFKDNPLEDFVLPFQTRMRMENLLTLDNIQLIQLFENELLWIAADNCMRNIEDLVDEGKLLLRYTQEREKDYCRQFAFEAVMIDLTTPVGLPAKFAPKRAIVLNEGFGSSLTFNSVYNPELHDIMVFFVRLKSKKWKVSLRGNKHNVDCSLIAETFGGNGHKDAAGFLCDDLPFSY